MLKNIPGRLVARLVLLALPALVTAQEKTAPAIRSGEGTAEIRGKITISRREETRLPASRDQMFGMYSMHGGDETSLILGHPVAGPVHLSERAAVYLEGEDLGQGPYVPPEKSPSLDQRNLQFHPQVLPVLVGTRVEFPNRDNLFHNVFSYSQPKEFDLGRYPKDDSRAVTFDRPGVVRVYCDIHSRMSATILVLKHPYFATPDDGGTYVLPPVPPGKYRVVLWYDRDVLERKTIEVKQGETAQVDFND